MYQPWGAATSSCRYCSCSSSKLGTPSGIGPKYSSVVQESRSHMLLNKIRIFLFMIISLYNLLGVYFLISISMLDIWCCFVYSRCAHFGCRLRLCHWATRIRHPAVVYGKNYVLPLFALH